MTPQSHQLLATELKLLLSAWILEPDYQDLSPNSSFLAL